MSGEYLEWYLILLSVSEQMYIKFEVIETAFFDFLVKFRLFIVSFGW